MPYHTNKKPVIFGNIKYEIKDGIVYIERLERVQFGVERLRKSIEHRIEYMEELSYPVIIFGHEMISMDKPSREFLAGEGSMNVLSRAFVTEKSQGKWQLNFFVSIYKQSVPIQIFESLEPAIEWSKQFNQHDF